MKYSPKSIGLALFGILVGTAILYFLGGQNPDFLPSYFLMGVNGVLLAFPLSRIVTGELPWYSPHAFALTALFLFYSAAPAIMILDGVESEAFDRPLTGDEYFAAMFVSTIGIGCYLIGRRFGPKKTTLPAGIEWYFTDTREVQGTFNIACIGLWLIGMLAWTYIFATGGGGESVLSHMGSGRRELMSEAGGFVFHLAKFAYVGALLYLSRNKLNVISIGMLCLTTMVLLAFGSRSFVAILVLGAFIVYRYRFLNKEPLLVWAAMLVGLFFLLSFWVLLRYTRGDIAQAAEIYQESTEGLQNKLFSVLGYFHFIVPMAEVIRETGDKLPYQYGKTFGTLLYVIPSFIWAGQYYFTSGSQVYMRSLLPDRVGLITVTPSMFAEFYMNFGWPGFVVFMMMFGWLIRFVEVKLIGNPARRNQVVWIVLSALFTVNLIRVMKNGFGTITFFLYFLGAAAIPYFPNLRFLFNPPSTASASEHAEDADEYASEPEAVESYA